MNTHRTSAFFRVLRVRALLLCCGLCVVGVNAAQPQTQTQGLVFESTSCADALKRATSEKKSLLVLFSGDWLAEQEAQIKNTVLQDKQVVRAAGGRVVAVRADAVRDTEAMRQFHIRVLPTLVLLGADGNELARWAGVPKAGALAKDLSAVLDSGKSLAELNAPDKSANSKKHYQAALAFEETGAYDDALKEYRLAYDGLRIKPATGIHAGDVVFRMAAMREFFPMAETVLRDYLEKYRARIATNPNAVWMAHGAREITRALGDGAAAISLFQQTQPGKAREELKWEAFAIFAHKQNYAQAVALTSPGEALSLVKGKARLPMFGLCGAIYGYCEARDDPRLKEFRNDRFQVVKEEFAQVLIFEAYAGAGDEQTAGEIAQVILGIPGKKMKTKNIAPLHAALERARPGGAAQFAQKINLPPVPVAPPAPPALAQDARSKQEAKQESVDANGIVKMAKFVVTEKRFGVIPVWCRMRCGIWGGHVIQKMENVCPYMDWDRPNPVPIGPSLESLGLKESDRLVAVDGKTLLGMSLKQLEQLWLFGEIGAPVKLTVQGGGKDESVFREVVVKRIRNPYQPSGTVAEKSRQE